MTDKTQRFKSPPFPSLTLEVALKRAEQLMSVAPSYSVPVSTAATIWGFSPKSSSITSVIGALNQYGLLDDEGAGETRKIKVSSLGESILLDKREVSIERSEALKKAALMPKVFQELWSHYKTADVDNGTLVYELTLGRKSVGKAPFSEDAAIDVAKKYKASLMYAGLDGSGSEPELGEDAEEDTPRVDESSASNLASGAIATPVPKIAATGVVHPIIQGEDRFEERKALDEGHAILTWPKDLSTDSVEDMEYWLNGVLRQIRRRVERPK